MNDDFPESYLMPAPLKPVLMTVEESVHYALDGIASVYDWASNSPPGVGYVRLGSNHRTFCVSMFHQLHCLRLLRVSLTDPSHPLSNMHHSQHCLNYIRQMVLCSPDLTLEPYDPLEKDFDQDRVGVTHVCRDWSAVYAELTDNWNRWEQFQNSTAFI